MLRPGAIAHYDLAPTAIPQPWHHLYHLLVGRGDVEQLRIERLANFVATELATLDSARRLVGKCQLSVDGYNDDPRDLSQIPEVRAYFQRVAEEVPLLLFLLEPVKAEIMLYAALVGDGRRTGTLQPDSKGGPPVVSGGTMFTNQNRLSGALLSYCEALGQWLQQQGILDDEEHPMWKAQERSIDAIRIALEDKRPMLKPVR